MCEENNHVFYIKKPPEYISFRSCCHSRPQRKELKTLAGCGVRSPLGLVFCTGLGCRAGWPSARAGGPWGAGATASRSGSGREPAPHLPAVGSSAPAPFPGCFTSCRQGFSTFRPTSTPSSHVLRSPPPVLWSLPSCRRGLPIRRVTRSAAGAGGEPSALPLPTGPQKEGPC